MWIKENINKDERRIITAEKPKGKKLIDVTIFHLDRDYDLIKKIIAENVNISSNEWVLENVTIFVPEKGIMNIEKFDTYMIKSIYNYEKINSLFKDINTISFLDLTLRYKKLINNGYNEFFLNESLHKMLTLPFFFIINDRSCCYSQYEYIKKIRECKVFSTWYHYKYNYILF